MCGICGYVNLDNAPILDGKIARSMADAIIHRGPDDEGLYIKDNVVLGHRRLSIIDLEQGHQPIINAQGNLAIVYNGEVYNFLELKTELINRGYVFHTRSDTEVVLNAYAEWGAGCLARFNGMFAMAIWDGRKKELFLARDRFGKKPLYYTSSGNCFIFSSELKSLYCHPAVKMDIDRMAMAKYFAHDYIPAPRTIIKDVCKLEAGHYLVIKGREVINKRYWDFRFNLDGSKRPNVELTKKMLIELLRESVRKRLVSDVPLGVFLSGGIDSSAVVAMMATLMDPRDIKTFAIGFKEKSYNEADSASFVAKHFKTDHSEKILDSDMMMAALPKVLGIIDEPFADSSIIPTYLVSSFTRERVTVALGGDGGDELFMGYPSFIAHRIASIYGRMPSFAKKMTSSMSGLLPGGAHYMSLKFKMDRFLQGIEYPEAMRHQVWIGSYPPGEQKAMFADKSDKRMFDPNSIYNESIDYFNTYSGLCGIDRIEYLYIKTYLTDDILTKVDRASMAASLEVRAPFLDTEIADFSGTIPNNLKLRGFTTKYILKEALSGILPKETIYKKKHGFAVPIGNWFRGGLRPILNDVFSKEAVLDDGIFDYGYVSRLLDDHLSAKRDNGRKIWALFVFQMWYNKWIKKAKGDILNERK